MRGMQGGVDGKTDQAAQRRMQGALMKDNPKMQADKNRMNEFFEKVGEE